MVHLNSILPHLMIQPIRPVGLSEFAWRLMQAEDRRFTLHNLKLIAVMAAAMILVFAVLDHFAYPEHVTLFTALRWTCASLTMVILLMIRSRMGKRFFRFFTVLLPLIPAYFVSATIFLTKDPASDYYAGLSLCIAATGFLFHWTYREAFVVSGSVLILYLVACSPAIALGMNGRMAAGLFSNLIFLIATGVVVVAGSLARDRIRAEEFKGRDRLRQKKIALRANAKELEKTLNDLKETENQLIQSGKMSSLGQLSAGMIHEIGNPLNHSNQALFLIKRRLKDHPEDGTINEAVDDIQDSIDRMKDLVKELREFSHKRSEVLIEFPAREVIDVARRMLRKELSDTSTTLEVKIGPHLRIEGVKNQLVQVFVNLIHNAIQAMYKARTGRANLIVISASTEEDRVIISVRDNGPGIPDSLRSRIFDPFFTTKEVGEGTGLGLSICFRIIEAHRGTIQVVSDGQSFCDFRLNLPCTIFLSKPSVETTASHHTSSHPADRHDLAIH